MAVVIVAAAVRHSRRDRRERNNQSTNQCNAFHVSLLQIRVVSTWGQDGARRLKGG
jgi:hypothetical protein